MTKTLVVVENTSIDPSIHPASDSARALRHLIRRREPLTIVEIAQAFDGDVQRAVEAVRQLQKSGLVRVTSPRIVGEASRT